MYKLFQSLNLFLTLSYSLAQKGNSLTTTCLSVNSKFDYSWIIDSGATDHMTSCPKLFSSYSLCACNKNFKIADSSFPVIVGIGTVKLTPLLILHDVLHVSNLSCNLSFISIITSDHQCQANFYSSYCEFQELTSGRMIGSAREKDGFYYFEDGSDSDRQCQSTCLNSIFVPKASVEHLHFLVKNGL